MVTNAADDAPAAYACRMAKAAMYLMVIDSCYYYLAGSLLRRGIEVVVTIMTIDGEIAWTTHDESPPSG